MHLDVQSFVEQFDIVGCDAGVFTIRRLLLERRPGGIHPQPNFRVIGEPGFLDLVQQDLTRRPTRNKPAIMQRLDLRVRDQGHSLGQDIGQNGFIPGYRQMKGNRLALRDADIPAHLEVGDLELIRDEVDHRHEIEQGICLAGGNRHDRFGRITHVDHFNLRVGLQGFTNEKPPGDRKTLAEKIFDASHFRKIFACIEHLHHLDIARGEGQVILPLGGLGDIEHDIQGTGLHHCQVVFPGGTGHNVHRQAGLLCQQSNIIDGITFGDAFLIEIKRGPVTFVLNPDRFRSGEVTLLGFAQLGGQFHRNRLGVRHDPFIFQRSARIRINEIQAPVDGGNQVRMTLGRGRIVGLGE